MPPDLALWLTLISSNYPCLELIFMVPKVFEPLKFDCIMAGVGMFNYAVDKIIKPKQTSYKEQSALGPKYFAVLCVFRHFCTNI